MRLFGEAAYANEALKDGDLTEDNSEGARRHSPRTSAATSPRFRLWGETTLREDVTVVTRSSAKENKPLSQNSAKLPRARPIERRLFFPSRIVIIIIETSEHLLVLEQQVRTTVSVPICYASLTSRIKVPLRGPRKGRVNGAEPRPPEARPEADRDSKSGRRQPPST